MLHDAMKQNNLLQEKIIAMQNDHDKAIKEQNKVIQDIIPKIGNQTNSNNNIINVQMFLNEKCGEAMSIQNFANQLFITMDDLNNNKKDCISNVVLKNLKPLSITQRPFHYLLKIKSGCKDREGRKKIMEKLIKQQNIEYKKMVQCF